MGDAAEEAANRVGSLAAADFAAAVGGPLSVRLVADADGSAYAHAGAPPTAAILVAAVGRPTATMPGSAREAFSLRLKMPDPGAFASGHALIDVPGVGLVGPVYLERSLSPPGDIAGAYFSINFN